MLTVCMCLCQESIKSSVEKQHKVVTFLNKLKSQHFIFHHIIKLEIYTVLDIYKQIKY